jgi:hypothetical protein
MDSRDQRLYEIRAIQPEFDVAPLPGGDSCDLYEISDGERYIGLVDSIEGLSNEILLDYGLNLKPSSPIRKRLNKLIIFYEISHNDYLGGCRVCGLEVKECINGSYKPKTL